MLHHNKKCALMSQMGHYRTSRRVRSMSTLLPEANVAERDHKVRFVPIADIETSICANRVSVRAVNREVQPCAGQV